MEENNKKKIGLSTILLIIALIVIAVMGVYIYKLKNDKTVEIQKSEELKSQVSNLNGTVKDLQGKINTISKTINSGDSENETSDSSSNAEVDTIAKELFEKGSEKIRRTEYSDYSEYEYVKPSVEKEINGEKYSKTKTLYSDVKNEYSEIFADEALDKVLNKRFADVDGYLYVIKTGATGWDVKDVSVTKISEKNGEISYNVKYNNVQIDDSVSEEETCNMTIKLIDGEYKIVSTDYCNL